MVVEFTNPGGFVGFGQLACLGLLGRPHPRILETFGRFELIEPVQADRLHHAAVAHDQARLDLTELSWIGKAAADARTMILSENSVRSKAMPSRHKICA